MPSQDSTVTINAVHNDGLKFEEEVRTIARALWGSAPGDGAAELISGRERDVVFFEENVIHYIEATISAKLDKIKHDVRKMHAFRDTQTKRGKPVKLWIVTRDEPTPDQRSHCRECGVTILSLLQFRRSLVDAESYLELRRIYRFGSAARPDDGSADISDVKFQPVGIRNVATGERLNLDQVAAKLAKKQQLVLLGDYGMGKSINLYHLFLLLRKLYFQSEGRSQFPVLLNLRDHWGQDDPVEALYRHAAKVGFGHATQLVRALNAGRLLLLLDGFDEIAMSPWSSQGKMQLRALRQGSVALVKQFVDCVRGRSGLIVAGREHFFDTQEELRSAFGLPPRSDLLALDEFNDDEARKYLVAHEQGIELPNWLPRRPLLLAYLAARNLLSAVLQVADDLDPSAAWSRLLDLICEREAAIHKHLSAPAIRGILEGLANETRVTSSGIGPISENHLAEAFRAQTGAYPDESARPLLQRLPGLSARFQEDGTRSFLDPQLLDVLRASTVIRFVESPYSDPRAGQWQHGLGSLGTSCVAERLASLESATSRAVNSVREAQKRWSAPTLALDLLQVSLAVAPSEVEVDFEGLEIEGGVAQELDLTGAVPINLRLIECMIEDLSLPSSVPENLFVENSIVGRVGGVVSRSRLPEWIRPSTEVGTVEDAARNAQILEQDDLPLGLRVLLTIFYKLYVQSGSGRRENALYKGLPPHMRDTARKVLEIVEAHRMAFNTRRRGDTVWHGVAGQSGRAIEIYQKRGRIDDAVVLAVGKLRAR